MKNTEPGSQLRPAPSRNTWSRSQMGRFLERIEARTGRHFGDYEEAWAWSVENLEDFWAEVWDHFEIITHAPYSSVLAERTMPGATWFDGARINYTEHILRSLARRPDATMVKSRSQTNGSFDWTGARLTEEVERIQQGLLRHGIKAGDRVAGYLPNIPQTLASYLAVTGLGAIWCCVPPEMGVKGVLGRIGQLEPRLLISIDGYRWGDKPIAKLDDLAAIRSGLPGMDTVLLPYLDTDIEVDSAAPGAESYADFTAERAEVTCLPVPFEHPLTVLFSSGTTGTPKAIVHSHGGLLLEHHKAMGLHFDLSEADTAYWFSTTGWMVWTLGVSSLLVGATVVLQDGDPNWPSLDGPWSQWAVMAETEATYMGTGSAYMAACAHAGVQPGKIWDLSRLREIQCSGSPLAADVAGWVYDAIAPEIMLAPTSGGTDICAAFLGGSPLSAVHAGEMACRPLGVAVDAWDREGNPLHGEPGELVATLPMPSMPAFFWNDPESERYRSSYFNAFEGVWRHGDWLVRTERDTWVITGRSDATLNRGGVRLGTAEFYAMLEGHPGVNDALVMHFEQGGAMGQLVLLVEAGQDADTAALERSIRTALRTQLSPRHVPDHVLFVRSIPRTRTGKRLEIPLKRLVQGGSAGVIDTGVLVNPQDLDETVQSVSRILARG
ncbi:acetoacetate--CoA ligase [Paeniglutamicibacter sp. NPDC012692]|uniref:acetoacetate--CoA ligase n=1 Tax=Paeniglutamicibacter sp. NPDC012692 TaxID=3364388 RepID=UPI00368FC8B0